MPKLSPANRRLVELDALRGIAALTVVLFHYTTRFDELYGHAAAPAFSVPWGHYGVNLFFMISGFVIFMTLARTRRIADFVVSRFSRLYPAYWAAIALTLAITGQLDLPGKTVGTTTALANLLMFHGLFNVPNVDGVYWTLLVELVFYSWSLLAFAMGLLNRIHAILIVALLLRWVYFVAASGFGIELSWTISQLLNLPYIAWFACGIMIYRLTHNSDSPRKDLAIILAAIGTLGIVESAGLAALAAALSLVLYLAGSSHLKLLRLAVFVWLGDISYTLYLLHENIGWALMLQMKAHGINTTVSVIVTLLVAFGLASLVTRTVEKPAMVWIRGQYKKRRLAISQ